MNLKNSKHWNLDIFSQKSICACSRNVNKPGKTFFRASKDFRHEGLSENKTNSAIFLTKTKQLNKKK